MQIAVHDHLSFLLHGLAKSLDLPDDGEDGFHGALPASVQICACQRAPVVSINNAVDVDHGHNFDDKLFSKNTCLRCVRKQKVNRTFHHVACITFTRVNPGTEKHSLSFQLALRGSLPRDRQVLALVSCQRSTQRVSCYELGLLFIFLNLLKISHQVTVGIREAVREVDGVPIVLEIVSETQRVEVA